VAPDDPEEEAVPDTLSPQVPIIDDVLDAFGIARVGMPGYEADDVIGTLATRADGPVDIVTGDRDLFQLVDDIAGVRVLYTAKGVSKAEVIDEAAVSARYGIPGRSYADFATLRGDPSDGLPGVPGIGDKTAAALLTRFGSLDAALAAVRDGDTAVAPGVRTRLLAATDYLAVAPTVVGVARDLPLPSFDDRLPAAPRHPDKLEELAERWGLRSPATRLTQALAAVG
jgi:5'-3' exonuclease